MPTSSAWPGGDDEQDMKVLVTGADGFVGRHLVRRLIETGHEVSAGCRPGGEPVDRWLGAQWQNAVQVVDLEITEAESVMEAVSAQPEAIVHLAAMAYSRDAQADPAQAWNVNVGGTAQLLRAAAERRPPGSEGPIVVVTSTAEVYGDGEPRPRVETDVPRPVSPYGWSKLGAEVAAGHASNAWGLRVMVARPFPATGPGQINRMIPGWLAALRGGQKEIEGDPTVVRDYLDVRDLAEAFLALLGTGRPGETYNIATGREIRFGELLTKLGAMVGVQSRLVPPLKPRIGLPHLVGDPGKLRQHTGWQPTIALEQTLADMIGDAQAH
jgi:GDP-4-dehydro-6-deoxy-D-mannose reductase